MIEENAIVVKAEGHTVWLESAGSHGCGQCQHKEGCGQTVFSQLFGIEKAQFKTETEQILHAGDQVLLGIDEKAIVKGSLLVYFLPLLSMILFASLAAGLSNLLTLSHEGLIIAGGLAGLYAGFRFARSKAAILIRFKAFQPVILKRL